MLPYLILFAFVAVGAIAAALKPASIRPPRLIIPALIIILMIGFRREVGGDWWNYLIILDRVAPLDLFAALQRTEPAYGLLNWIAARPDWGIWFPNLVCGAIFTWGLVAFCRLQPNAWLALAVAVPYFVIGVGMGYTRQSAAIGLVMLALTSFYRGETLRMVAYVTFAAMFHTSALIMIPLLGLAVVRQGVLATALLAMAAAFLYYQFSDRLLGRFETYTNRTYEGGGTVLRLAMNVIPALIFLAFRRRFSTTVSEMRLWSIMALFTCLSMILVFLVSATVIVDRLALYMIPLQILVLSRIPAVFGTGSRQNILFLSLILAFSLILEVAWLNLGRWGHAWLPYRNYLWDAGTGEAPPRSFQRMR